MKYIDADILRVKITDLCANANFYQQRAMEESNREDFVSSGGEISAYAKVFSLINSLQQEQPKVDIEKELEEAVRKYKPNGDFGWGTLYNIAYYFYELGLNARKEE